MPAKPVRAARASDKSSYHHGNLREALVEAAIEILAREGISALGLRCTARAAGVSAAAPYHHFGSKEGMLAAVATEGFKRLTASQEAEEGTSELSPRERMHRLARAYVHFARRNPQLYQLMFGRTVEDKQAFPELMAAAEASYQRIESAIRDRLGERPDDPLTVKLALNGGWAMVHGLATLLNEGKISPGVDGNPEEEELIAAVTELWCRGIEQGLQGWSWPDEA